MRDILWKNYARNRQLNVRLRERSVAHGQRILAYLLSGPDDEAAAAAARAALESGAFGDDWQFSADGTETPCGELDAALRAVARSRALARTTRAGGSGVSSPPPTSAAPATASSLPAPAPSLPAMP